MTDTELLEIIARAEREGWTDLDLSGKGIKEIPPEIAQLANLQRLDLSNNQINIIPDTIAQIVSLKTLILWGNEISELPESITQLFNLYRLDLGINQIKTIPSWISKLINLQKLSLHSNKVSIIPDSITQLINLRRLSLRHNQITVIPDKISNLSNLQELFLYNNQISLIPDTVSELSNLQKLVLYSNKISNIPDVLIRLTNLKELHLEDNPLPIPVEILNDYENPKGIFDFWLERPRQPLNEAKVILVGQGTVGKTSLVKRLLDNQFDSEEAKTDGIQIRDWQLQARDETVKLRVWDFGGQEIMHATHQFFLTERSLYLLVMNNREDELANRLEYWLKLIETLGNSAPVIIVGNKVDEHPLDLDERGLRHKYPNIKAFIGTSCAKGLGIADLKQKIREVIAADMPHVFDPIPVKWLDVKNKLEQDDRDYISYQEYEQKCIDSGITRESSRKTLVKLLHELGIILNFSEDRRLKDTNVLNPEWVTLGAYKIINDNLLMTQHKGVLTWQECDRIFKPKSRKDSNDYGTNEAKKFILDMMEKFELCFPMENSRDREYPNYLIPDLLPKPEPHTEGWEDALNFEYHYEKILPSSVISRFIVKAHRQIARIPQPTYWRTGVILASQDGNRAYVKADLEDAKILIRISGNKATRRSFLTFIREIFADIHDCPRLTPDERISLPDNPQVTVSYKHLLNLENRGKTEYSDSDRDYNIRELLDGIEDRRDHKQKDDLRDDFRGDRYSPPIVNVNISNNNQQQTKVMTEPEKPRLKNHSKTKEIKLPPVVVASMAFVLLFLTTAALVLTFAGILNITSFIIAMFSIVLLIVIGVSFILKVTGQIEGQSFEKIILAVLKQLTLYDAFLGKIGDILGKSKNK
jgi:internalin A